jgi:hypothetical protein
MGGRTVKVKSGISYHGMDIPAKAYPGIIE